MRKLFSKEQRAFFAAHAPEGIALDDLSILGPIFVLKLRMNAGRARAAGSSPRCGSTPTARACSSSRPAAAPAEAFQVAAEAARVPRRPRRRPLRRAADEDPQGARVLRRGTARVTIGRRAGSGARSATASATPRRASPRCRRSASRRATRCTCSRSASDASVKVRDGADGRQAARARRRRRARAVAAGPEGAVPAVGGRRRAVLAALGVDAGARARADTLEQLVDEVVGREPAAARGRRAQAPRALHRRRLHGRADRAAHRRGRHAHDRRSSPRTRTRRDRGGARRSGSTADRTSASRAG